MWIKHIMAGGNLIKMCLTFIPVSKWVKILLPFQLLLILLTIFHPCHRFFQPSVFCKAFRSSSPILLPLWFFPDKASSFFLNSIPWAKKRSLLLSLTHRSTLNAQFPLPHGQDFAVSTQNEGLETSIGKLYR